MSKRIIMAGLTALCALAFGALAASAAQAENTTAYTCLPGGSEFGDAHCVGAGTGFHHEAIPAGEATELTLKSAPEGARKGIQELETEQFGTSLLLQGNGIECVGCTAENNEISATEMDVRGPAAGHAGGRIVYSGVKVIGFETQCKVEDPVTGIETVRTEPLKFTTTGTNKAKIQPETGTRLAIIHVVNISGCPVATNFNVEGFAEGTAVGATLQVNDSTDLKVLGEPARLTGEATLEAGKEEGGVKVHHPVALT